MHDESADATAGHRPRPRHGQGDGQTCRATRTDGRPCTVRARPSGFCWGHDPALAEARQQARRKGGHGKSTAARLNRRLPPNLRGVLSTLLEALDEVHTGEIDPRVASAMGSLAGAISKLYEVAELERRLEQLEQQARQI